MGSSFVVEDKNESIKKLGLDNIFFNNTIASINTLDSTKLKVFFSIMAQLEDQEFFDYVLDKLNDEDKKKDIKKTHKEEKIEMSSTITYDILKEIGFSVPETNQSSNPVKEVKNSLKLRKMKNRGLSRNTHGNYKIEPNTFAEYLISRLQIAREGEKVFYSYDSNEGIYSISNEIEVKIACKQVLNEVDNTIWKIRFEREYLESLRMLTRTAESLEKENSTENLMAFNNGYFNLENGNFYNFSPDYFFTSKVSYDYDAKAKAPKFGTFLKEIFENDAERINLVEEMLGYWLEKDTRIHKLYILKGEGGNGKSVFINTVENLLGVKNVSNTSLTRLGGSFGFQDIEDKLVNISGENEIGNKNIDTENIKSITGGDRVEIEKKNKDSYSKYIYTRLIISVNNDFTFSDTSHGILRRLMFIPFNVTFEEPPLKAEDRIEGKLYQNNNLKDELLEELSGIFNIAYKGLKRLKYNELKYTKSDICEEELEKYKKYSDPISEFIEDELQIDSDLQMTKPEVNKYFVNWQKRNEGMFRTITGSGAATLVKKKLEGKNEYIIEKKVNGTMVLEGIGPIESSSRISNGGQEVPPVI